MTILKTFNYGIAYCDTSTALVDLADASKQAADTIDAALGRGGIAPPNATTQAQLAARITELERLGIVERGTMTTTFTSSGTAEQRITGTINGLVPVLTAGRAYRATLKGRVSVSTAGAQVTMNLRAARGTALPVVASPIVGSHQHTVQVAGAGGAFDFMPNSGGGFQVAASGQVAFAGFVICSTGTATVGPDTRGIVELFIEDIGLARSGMPTLP